MFKRNPYQKIFEEKIYPLEKKEISAKQFLKMKDSTQI